MNGFGINGIGTKSNSGINGFGLADVGTKCNAGMNGFGGGFGQLGTNTAMFIDKIPNPLKGLATAGIILGAAIISLKKCKKPPVPNVQKQGLFTKIFNKKK